ncbi:MAG: leucine-rich repeat domain-containing protein, partial [Angelakisella sp.]
MAPAPAEPAPANPAPENPAPANPVPAEPVCDCGAVANTEVAVVHESTCPLYQAPVEQSAEEPKPVVQMTPAESGTRIDPARSGNCGAAGNETNVTWALTQNNADNNNPTCTLTLTGTGAMADYGTKETPWYLKREAITQIILPEGLTSIGESAFLQTNITDITIPSTVTSIGTIAFWNCNTICTEIPAAVTKIGATAFYGNFTLTVNEGNQAYLAENNVLYNKDKTKLVQVSRLIKEFTIPNTVTEICDFAMNGCKLLTGTLTMPDSVRTVGNGAFGGTNYTGIVLSENMTEIGDAAFSGLPLSGELIIPDTITEIGANAFAKCKSLTEINIPETVTSIGYAAFSFNTGVTKITVPLGDITYGKNAEGKSYIFSMCNIDENKVAVSGNLKTVVIGSTPKDVNVYTLFSNSWKGLETLVLGSGVGELDVWNLSDSGNLSKVLYPSTLTLTRSNDRFTNVATKYTLATETSLPFGDTLPMLSFDKQAPTGITYTSSHPEIVSVDANGNMKALQLTNEPVTISASYEDCVFTKLTLTVLKDASSAAISGMNNAYPYTGEEVKPVPTVKLGD